MKQLNYLVILAGIFLFSACSTKDSTTSSSLSEQETSTSSKEATEMIVEISLVKEGKEMEKKEVSVEKGTTLMEAMKANFDLVEENKMITSIDGIEQNTKESYYWTYKINDEMINTGAAETTLNPDDKVVFTYEKF